MSKNEKKPLFMAITVLVIVAVISFLIPVTKNTVYWLAVGFMALAALMQVFVLKTAFGRGTSAKSKFYGFPIARVGICYLVVQIVVSIIFMLCAKWIPVWPVVVTSLLLFLIAAVGFVVTDTVRNEVERQDNKLQSDISCISTLRSIVYPLSSQCTDPASTDALNKLADEFRYSDPVSSESLKPVEQELEGLVEQLQSAVTSEKADEVVRLCNETSRVLSERNHLCKLNKGK